MNSDSKIKDAQDRVIDVYTKRPQAALSTIQANARIEDKMTCVFTHGDHQLVMDMPEILGGENKGPTPGLYARASISGCVAMGIKFLAARKELAFKSISVDVEMDFDDAAIFGLGEASAGPLETRLAVQIETEVDEAQVFALVDEALAMDTYFLALRDPQQVKLDITVKGES